MPTASSADAATAMTPTDSPPADPTYADRTGNPGRLRCQCTRETRAATKAKMKSDTATKQLRQQAARTASKAKRTITCTAKAATCQSPPPGARANTKPTPTLYAKPSAPPHRPPAPTPSRLPRSTQSHPRLHTDLRLPSYSPTLHLPQPTLQQLCHRHSKCPLRGCHPSALASVLYAVTSHRTYTEPSQPTCRSLANAFFDPATGASLEYV
jgi:hypothetical protein